MPYARTKDRKAACRRYYLEHGVEIRARRKQRRDADPETHKARDLAYYHANRKRIIRRNRTYAIKLPFDQRLVYFTARTRARLGVQIHG
jgi:hypothetical protein